MAVWLNTRGKNSLAIAVCGRCNRKFPIGELQPDPNVPALMVCEKDRDNFDPYRLPARQTENITLRFPRPDVPINTDPAGAISEDGDYFIITEDGDDYLEF